MLQEIYVSFSSMSLRAFSETDKDYLLDDNALHATETTMVVPFDQFRMTHHVWQVSTDDRNIGDRRLCGECHNSIAQPNRSFFCLTRFFCAFSPLRSPFRQIFHTQRQHMVLYAADGSGKTRFLDWVFAMKDKREKGWHFSHTSMQQKRITRHFCQWLSESLEIRPDRLFEKADYNGFFVDDVHLALESKKQPTAMAELLRSVMERKGTKRNNSCTRISYMLLVTLLR